MADKEFQSLEDFLVEHPTENQSSRVFNGSEFEDIPGQIPDKFRDVEFRGNEETRRIEWRYVDTDEWIPLVTYESLVGVDIAEAVATLQTISDTTTASATQVEKDRAFVSSARSAVTIARDQTLAARDQVVAIEGDVLPTYNAAIAASEAATAAVESIGDSVETVTDAAAEASLSKQQAADSATAANLSASLAGTSETNAVAANTAAQQAKTSAETAQGSASGSATTATTAATTAQAWAESSSLIGSTGRSSKYWADESQRIYDLIETYDLDNFITEDEFAAGLATKLTADGGTINRDITIAAYGNRLYLGGGYIQLYNGTDGGTLDFSVNSDTFQWRLRNQSQSGGNGNLLIAHKDGKNLQVKPNGDIAMTRLTDMGLSTDLVQAIMDAMVPAGTVAYTAAAVAPAGWYELDGSLKNRTTDARLFNAIGTFYGAGDGSTTFALPQARGEFIRALDSGRGIDASRTRGSPQGDAIRNITGTFGNFYRATNAGTSGSFAVTSTSTTPASSGTAGAHPGDTASVSFNASLQVATASENRPRNVAYMAIIKR